MRHGRDAAAGKPRCSCLLFCKAGKNLVLENEKRGKRALKLSGPFFVVLHATKKSTRGFFCAHSPVRGETRS